jgi:DNA-directed RNA polymerase specialized sigma24 family protein
MDNASLCRLIREALQSESPEEVEKLALVIDQLPEIRRYLGKGWLPYYEKALPTTENDVRRNINKFPKVYGLNLETTDCQNPSDATNIRKQFISWVMIILKRDCQDVKRKKTPIIYSMDKVIGEGSTTIGETIPSLSDIGDILENNELRDICTKLKQYIELDTDHELQNCYLRDRPDVNCQELLKLRYLNDSSLTLKNIAEQFQVSIQTIKSRFDRHCLPRIKKIALRIGYNQGDLS